MSQLASRVEGREGVGHMLPKALDYLAQVARAGRGLRSLLLKVTPNSGECYKMRIKAYRQCCGSESETGSVGSVCFWASWIRIRIH